MTLPVSPELLRQVRQLELRTHRLVSSVFAGEYHSVFKGQGMEFAEVREYQPGDEVRSIDWNVSARMQRPFVKRYIEERELTLMLLVDGSGSSAFGTARRFKNEVATELSALLAFAAARNNDRVGLVWFSDQIEHVVPPRKGRRQMLRVVRDLLALRSQHSGTDLTQAFEYANRLLNHRAIVFVMSDFIATGYDVALTRLAQRHDVIAVTIIDPAEQTLPDVGIVELTDPETGRVVRVNTRRRSVRAQYEQRVAESHAVRRRLFRRLGIDELVIRTDGEVVTPLLQFFRMRERRRRVA